MAISYTCFFFMCGQLTFFRLGILIYCSQKLYLQHHTLTGALFVTAEVMYKRRTVMKRIYTMALLVLLALAGFSCKQAQDIKAFTEAKYSLQGVSDIKLNGIDVEERIQERRGFSPEEQDSLLAAVTSNSLQVSSTLALNVALKDQKEEDRNLTITKLKWLLEVDGEEALTGTVEETMVLQEGLNLLPIQTPVGLVAEGEMPSYTGLSRLITLLGQRTDIRERVTLKIKPTIKTPVGNIESPTFITVTKPSGTIALR